MSRGYLNGFDFCLWALGLQDSRVEDVDSLALASMPSRYPQLGAAAATIAAAAAAAAVAARYPRLRRV